MHNEAPQATHISWQHLSVEVQRRVASESIQLRILKRINHTLNTRIRTQARCRQRTTQINDIKDIHIPQTAHKSSDPAPDSSIMSRDNTRSRIKALAITKSILLNEVPDSQKGREGVAELDNAECCHDAHEAKEIWDGGGDYEGEGPIDWDDDCPSDLPFLGGEGWEVEEVNKELVVEDFDADVAV